MPKSRFYTRRGDDGTTGLLGTDRVPKYDPRPDAYGTVDEAQACLGVVRAGDCSALTAGIMQALQLDLHSLMAELAAAGEAREQYSGTISSSHVDRLEGWISQVGANVQMPQELVIPGDSRTGAALHLARTVVRRAERLVVRLFDSRLLANRQVVRYLNRLSSLLFVLAVHEDQVATASGRAQAGEEWGAKGE